MNAVNGLDSIFDAWQQKQAGHAYLLLGLKQGALSQLVERLLCERPEGANSCRQCASCVAIKNAVHPNLFWKQNEKKPLRIDDVRDLIGFAGLSCASSKPRVIVIEALETLQASAANALLKILEEPPASILFLMTTDHLRRVPATLISRCQKMRFSPEKQLIEDEAFTFFCERSAQLEKGAISPVAYIDALDLSAPQLLDFFMHYVHRRVTQEPTLNQQIFSFYDLLLKKREGLLRVSTLNAELMGYHLACEWVATCS